MSKETPGMKQMPGGAWVVDVGEFTRADLAQVEVATRPPGLQRNLEQLALDCLKNHEVTLAGCLHLISVLRAADRQEGAFEALWNALAEISRTEGFDDKLKPVENRSRDN